MNKYAFELGRKRKLCMHELLTMLGEANFLEKAKDIAIFEIATHHSNNIQALQDKLGGTIKIIEITDTLQKNPNQKILKDTFDRILEKNLQYNTGKIPFAVSLFNFNRFNKIDSKELLKHSKKFLKNNFNLNSRFINNSQENPRPSTIFKSKTIEKGIDINIINAQDKTYIGKTVSIQNIDKYSKRDFDKPKRDAKNGMLPPKLAQTMINLAGETKIIYDPFCGTGTVLMEGLLMGKEVIGSDLNQMMVNFTNENIKWLRQEENTGKALLTFQKDATKLVQNEIPEDIDAIITEGYLGRPFLNTPTPAQIEQSFKELLEMHKNWLSTIHKITSKDITIVMCKTGYRVNERILHMPNFKETIEKIGFKITETFTYERSTQIVIRDIIILKKI